MSETTTLQGNSILETELARVAEQDKIERLKIVETTGGFYVLANVQQRPPESLYLATRREPDKPRMFSDFKRLNALLRTMYPDGSIELTRESEYKFGQAKKVAKKSASKKKPKARK